jgi:hypothetical protein
VKWKVSWRQAKARNGAVVPKGEKIYQLSSKKLTLTNNKIKN